VGFFDGAGVGRSVVCASVGIVDDFSEGGGVGAFDGFGCLGLLISRSFLVGLSVGLRLGAFGCLVLLREGDAFVILFLDFVVVAVVRCRVCRLYALLTVAGLVTFLTVLIIIDGVIIFILVTRFLNSTNVISIRF